MDFALNWQPFPVVINCYIYGVYIERRAHIHIHKLATETNVLNSLTFRTTIFVLILGKFDIRLDANTVHTHTLGFGSVIHHFRTLNLISSCQNLLILNWRGLAVHQRLIWTFNSTTYLSLACIDHFNFMNRCVNTNTNIRTSRTPRSTRTLILVHRKSESESESEDHCVNEIQFIIHIFTEQTLCRLYEE